MSTCPEKDIHSLYLDNELPENYRLRYEEHLTKCSECRKEYERLSKIQKILKTDSSSISLTQKDMDESFRRLQARLSYNNVIKNTSPERFRNNFNHLSLLRDASIGVAVAIALVFLLPTARTSRNNSSSAVAFEPVARPDFLTPASLKISAETEKGMLNPAAIAVFDSENEEEDSVNLYTFFSAGDMENNSKVMVNYTGRRRNTGSFSSNFDVYDVFTPVKTAKRTSDVTVFSANLINYNTGY